MSNEPQWQPIETAQNDLTWTANGKVTKLLNAGHSIEEILTNKSLLQKEHPSIKYNYIIEKTNNEPQWQPIETAPKDGTLVLLYCIWYKNINVDYAYLGDIFVGGYSNDKCYDRWLVYWDDQETKITPTHWMPLPKPPKQ
jgi:hypothetical protein